MVWPSTVRTSKSAGTIFDAGFDTGVPGSTTFESVFSSGCAVSNVYPMVAIKTTTTKVAIIRPGVHSVGCALSSAIDTSCCHGRSKGRLSLPGLLQRLDQLH